MMFECFLSNAVLLAFVATTGTWFVTALGAGTVFFFKEINTKLLNMMLGFAAGVMIAASFWSLLEPAIARADATLKMPAYLVATFGFVFGAVFIYISDKIVTRAQNSLKNNQSQEKSSRYKRIIMLIFSITLHNIPEGLAVGVAFGALASSNFETATLLSAISVAVGIGLQNFPEGAAVSIPLRREGISRTKSFFYGQSSALVEPIAGVIGAMMVVYIEALLPFALSFAAGAMVLVAVHELIPECQSNKDTNPYFSTMGIIAGFSVMMLLDVMLG